MSRSLEGDRVLLGEVKWAERPLGEAALARELRALAGRQPPSTLSAKERSGAVRLLCVPAIARGSRPPDVREGPVVVTAAELLGAGLSAARAPRARSRGKPR